MAETTHLGVVWNPSKTTRAELEAALASAKARAGIDPQVSWYETAVDDPGRAATKAALAAGADTVVAAGGDGTVRAVAEVLAEAGGSASLSVAPLGTGNLLARNLGIELGDLAVALERALVGHPRSLDIGWAELQLDGVTERHAFAVMAGFGIDAHMITETNDELKQQAGWLAYVESLGRAVAASGKIEVRVALGGGPVSTIEAHTVIVGNCGTLQGGFTLLPDADPADGELDLLVLGAEGIGGWFDTLQNFVWNSGIKRILGGIGGIGGEDAEGAVSSDSVTHRRVQRLEMELAEPRVFEVDGDDLGETSTIAISVQANAIRVR